MNRLQNTGTTGDPVIDARVKTLVNNLELIKYYGHHYVRKTGLKRAIKELIVEVLDEVQHSNRR